MADPKKPAPAADPRPVRELAAALFARLYDPRAGKTADHQAAEALAAARGFYRVADSPDQPGG